MHIHICWFGIVVTIASVRLVPGVANAWTATVGHGQVQRSEGEGELGVVTGGVDGGGGLTGPTGSSGFMTPVVS